MIVNKLLSIKKDNNIILYNISFDDEKLCEFLNQLDERYTKTENDVIETTFVGLRPLNYGKYDSMKDICIVKEQGLHETRKEKESKEYFKSLGGSTKEWDFLSEEEKMIFMPIEGVRKGKMKLEVIYPSVLCKTIKDTFLPEDPKKIIIDGTSLTKLSNHILGIPNMFYYDKTIDLEENKKNWDDPGRAFFSKEDYNNYLNRSARSINKNDVRISHREAKNIYNDLGEILYKLQSVLYCEQIGMFPMDLKLSPEFEILKRFAIRNERFEWLDRKLDMAQIDYDGGAIINEMSAHICSNYDLDGARTEEKILNRIDRKSNEIKRLVGINIATSDEEEPIVLTDDVHELTKKIKAA